jgi:xylulokinase
MLYLQHGEPEVARRARWFLEPVDYLSMRWCGRAAASPASMTAAWLTDNRSPHLSECDRRLVTVSGVDAAKLPPLLPTASVIGHVSADVLEAVGLPLGSRVSVVTGTPDLHTAACGAGAVMDYEAHLAISTSSWIGAPVPFKKTDAFRQVASVPGLSQGRYLIANNHETRGLSFEWLRESASTTCRSRRRGPASCAPCSRAWPSTTGGCTTPWSTS